MKVVRYDLKRLLVREDFISRVWTNGVIKSLERNKTFTKTMVLYGHLTNELQMQFKMRIFLKVLGFL